MNQGNYYFLDEIKGDNRKMGAGWWTTHEYKRRSTRSISYFCGWKSLLGLLGKCTIEIERALIATLFETGGRASEVLSLRSDQFVDKGTYILILGMPVLKQKDPEKQRRNVPMLKSEPLINPMMEWVKERDGLLFPYKYDWLYKRVRLINREWWPHRFRGERASQLAIEKDFTVPQLMKWFGWSREQTPTRYVRMSVKDLVEKMSRGEI